MAEIKREPYYTELYDDDTESVVEVVCFDENHTLSDIARWIIKNKVDCEELARIIMEMLDNV